MQSPFMQSDSAPAIRPAKGGVTRRRVLAAAAGAATLPAWAVMAAPILIQFSHVVKADTPKGRAAQRFKELAESRTHGRVRVEIFPDSQLYKDREEIGALQLGAVQMLAPSLSKLSAIGGSTMEVFDLPYLFADQRAFDAVAQGPVGHALLNRLHANGIRSLAVWNNGFKVFTANRPLTGPDDLHGLRVRVQASRVLVAQMNALGAAVSVSPLVDVYSALQRGELDGEENTPSNILTQRINEVQSHLAVTYHGYLGYAVIVNERFWQGLPPDIRVELEGAMRDATAFANTIAADDNREALRRIAASGHTVVQMPSPEQGRRWRAAMQSTWSEASKWIEPATLADVQRAASMPP